MNLRYLALLLILICMPTFAVTAPQAKKEFEDGTKMAKCSAFEKGFSLLPMADGLNHPKPLNTPISEDDKAMYAIFAKHYDKGTAYNIASADAMYHALQQYDDNNLYASGLPRHDYSREFKIGYTIADTKQNFQSQANLYITTAFITPTKSKKLDYTTAIAYEKQFNETLKKIGCEE